MKTSRMPEISNLIRNAKRLFSFMLVAYVAYAGVLYFMQRNLIYYPSKISTKPAEYNLRMEQISLRTSDGIKLEAWYAAPESDNDPVIVFYHGNASYIGGRSQKFKGFMDNNMGVLAISYRGYGASEGEPTELGLYEDARTAIRYLMEKGIRHENIILYGESLGTGVAIQMATEFDVQAVVLEAPYSSIINIAREYYPLVPVDYLLEDKFDSIAKVDLIEEPILIMHGLEDNVIPVHHAKELYAAIRSPKKLHLFEGIGHSNIDIVETQAVFSDFIAEQKLLFAQNQR